MKHINFAGIALLLLFNIIVYLLAEDFSHQSMLFSWGAVNVAILLSYFLLPAFEHGNSPYSSAHRLVGTVYVIFSLFIGVIFMIWPPAKITWPLIVQLTLLTIYLGIGISFIKADKRAG